MKDYKKEYENWLNSPQTDPALKEELLAIKDDPKEIEERFYTRLEFGTAGLRGKIGAGTNRMNVHTVLQATQGLCDYMRGIGCADRSVAIAYDSRKMSREFALCTALCLCANGIKTFLYSMLHSVPQLSFTVRHYDCAAGVVITASHNPKEYNGYKVYWQDGGQVTPEQAEAISGFIAKTGIFSPECVSEEQAVKSGLLSYIGKEADEAYYLSVEKMLQNPALAKKHGSDLNIVYTPLHGSGFVPVTEILFRAGFTNVSVVDEQKLPDPSFPTVSAPNPEDPGAFTLATKLADKVGATAIFATDPDADRLGVAVKSDGGFTVLSGNQIGCLLIHYLLSCKKENGTLPDNGLIVKTIVSTRMADAICAKFGVEIQDVLTGFRYISEKIEMCERTGKQFLFGFEESFGFLAGGGSRDKDAVCSAMLISEACLYYARQNKTLAQVLSDMYSQYGYYNDSTKSYTLDGKSGTEKIKAAMKSLREYPPAVIAGYKVAEQEDYLFSRSVKDGTLREIQLPKSDVLRYTLENGAWICVRPSGTEPKLKLYIGTRAQDEQTLDALAQDIMRAADALLADRLK